jgi:hypothetical protein
MSKNCRFACLFAPGMALALLAVPEPAHSHGIAGNRYFDGTLTFDDPSVADEAILPYYSYIQQSTQGSNAIENRINGSFARLLTPTLQVTFDSGWIHQNWPTGRTSGFDTTNIGLKYEAYRNNQHEMLVSVGLAWGIGHSGSQAVEARTDPTLFNRVSFSAKGSAISPTRFHGYVLLPLRERLWTWPRLDHQEEKRSRPT